MRDHSEAIDRPARLARGIVASLAALLCLAAGGCTIGAKEAQVRDELRAFADTASTRVNIVADRLARTTEEIGPRAALNREKISVASMGIDNAVQSHAMTGLLDMTFQFELKARSAERRVERLKNPGTQPARPSDLDPFAEELLAVHRQNRDAIWAQTEKKLRPEQVKGLRAMIDDWYHDNRDLSRSSVKFTELEKYAGNDPSRSLVFTLVDLRGTNEQVDRIVWGAQRIYDNSHWQVRRILFDVIQELEQPRDEAIAAVAKAVADEREKTSGALRGVVNQIGRWMLGAAVLLATLLIGGWYLLRGRRRAAASDGARRDDVLRRVDAIERAVIGTRPNGSRDVPAAPVGTPVARDQPVAPRGR